jgi:hypothetical protein
MRKALIGSALACSLLFAAAPALAQPGGPAAPCSREDLEKAVAGYIEAQTKGDASSIPFGGEWITVNENFELSSMYGGMLGKAQKIDYWRTLATDTQTCSTFTEVVITNPEHPYVLGVTLSGRSARVSTVEMLVTDKDDWLFSAANTMKWAKPEKWDIIPEAQRDSRAVIQAAADAYLNLFSKPDTVVPWGTPCARLEGGIYSGKGKPGEATPEDSCNVGVPSGVEMADRTYVVDVDRGSVSVLLRMGKNQRPDAHTFRIENGKIRYVHTITVCQEEHCGFKYDDKTKAALGMTS